MPLIKICGMSCPQDALRIAQLDVDMIGFVFAESRRRVSIEQAKEMIAGLDKLATRPAVVGVFVNESPEKVNLAATQCCLDIVQFSGDESWEYCRLINHPFIKVLHITPAMNGAEIINTIEKGYNAGLKKPFICMLDARFDNQYGGGGKIFNWQIAREASAKYRIMVAGGLSTTNVAQLISGLKPLGVDASSLLETNGKKDIAKVEDFIKAVRSMQQTTDDSRDYLSKYLLNR